MGLRGLLVLCIVLFQRFLTTLAAPGFSKRLALEEISERYTKRTSGGIHLPIIHVENLGRRNEGEIASSVGLGDLMDFEYTVLVKIGNTVFPLLLDTGSSDLWAVSDACTDGCNGSTAKPYPQAGLRPIVDVLLRYGDSSSNGFASGVISLDRVQFAGITLGNQSFAAINHTNLDIVRRGISGILGVNFPITSVIWQDLFIFLLDPFGDRINSAVNTLGFSSTGDNGARRRRFPSIPFNLNGSSTNSSLQGRQLGPSSGTVDLAVGTWKSNFSAPIPRLIASGILLQPLVSITLPRDAIDIDSGSLGSLNIGELPFGVEASHLTWVPLRRYTIDEGGISGPSDSPFEIYPFTWEIKIDNVYLDGVLLPQTTLTPPFIGITALLDTGDPLIRGPADVITYINERLGPNGIFDCAKPHVLSFEIGGKMFPVDPRDLLWQQVRDTVGFCRAKLATTDTPKVGNFLYSWTLGVPFLKSVISAYYFGNITHPSKDPPKVGLLSAVPTNAGDLLKMVVSAASSSGNLPVTTQSAPSDYTITSLAPMTTWHPLVE